ncbi:unnamed protein product [Ectocarpus sp. 12 AP-2014]
MPPPRGPVNPRKKFGVKPGFSMLDWNLLKGRAKNLAGRDEAGMRGITKAEVRQHNKQHDCWSIFRGKVYNLTPFLHYHPGGIPEIMKGAGRDCTALFDKYHRWVNFDSLVGNLYLGPLVTEKELEASSGGGGGKEVAEAAGEGDAKDDATAARKEEGDGDVDGVADRDIDKTAVALEQMSTAGRQELDRAESTGAAV